MKKLLCTVYGLILLGSVSQAGAVVLSLTPSLQDAMPTDVVSVDLVVSGLGMGGPDSLGDFDIDIGFDAAALSLNGFSLGMGLGDIGLGEAIDLSFGDLGGGIVNVAELSLLFDFELDALQGAMVTLATFDFLVNVLPVGSSTTVMIDLVSALGDAFGNPLSVTAEESAVIRNPDLVVPEPASLALLALGMAGFGVSRRRRLAA